MDVRERPAVNLIVPTAFFLCSIRAAHASVAKFPFSNQDKPTDGHRLTQIRKCETENEKKLRGKTGFRFRTSAIPSLRCPAPSA